MGMFDRVTWNARLPVKNDSIIKIRMNPAQTKCVRMWEDYDWEMCDIVVTEDGNMLGKDGKVYDYTGPMLFYGNHPEDCFEAQFERGRLESVEHAKTNE